MKTSIDISDHLLQQARRLSRERGTTLRSLVEEGLRQVLAQQQQERAEELPPLVVYGRADDGTDTWSWESIRDEIYRGRGT